MKRRNLVPALAGVLFTLFVAGNLYAGGAKESAKPAPVAAPEKKTAKYVFFFVGDGLAMPTMRLPPLRTPWPLIRLLQRQWPLLKNTPMKP